MIKRKTKLAGPLLAIIMFIALTAGAFAQPQIPYLFYGDVTIGGSPASDGTVVTAEVGGVAGGAGLTVTAKIEDYTSNPVTTSAGGRYFFLVVGPPDATYVGKTIEFYVNGAKATETDTFVAGSTHPSFDLHVTAIPTPNPIANANTHAYANASSRGWAGARCLGWNSDWYCCGSGAWRLAVH